MLHLATLDVAAVAALLKHPLDVQFLFFCSFLSVQLHSTMLSIAFSPELLFYMGVAYLTIFKQEHLFSN